MVILTGTRLTLSPPILAKRQRMNRSFLFRWLLTGKIMVAATLCCGSCAGEEAQSKAPRAAGERVLSDKLLSRDKIDARLQEFSRIPVKGCTSSDLTLKGLTRLLNQHLQKAGRIERVIIVDPKLDADVGKELTSNFLSPLYGNTEGLDKEDLARQINSKSVADLLFHMPFMCNVGIAWYEDWFRVGSDWTQDLSGTGRGYGYSLRPMKPGPKP